MNKSQPEVWAKSGPPVSLKQHIAECLLFMNSLQKAFQRLPIADAEHFWSILKIGIVLHDLGKAHDEFQKLLEGKKSRWYHQRHELFSSAFVRLLDLSESDKELLHLIILGHHKDFALLHQNIVHGYKSGEEDFAFGEEGKLDWKEETQRLNTRYIAEIFKEYNLKITQGTLGLSKNHIFNYLNNSITTEDIKFTELTLLAGALKHCDHAASAGIIETTLFGESNFSFLYNTTWNPYHHQLLASTTEGNIILTAPTGSGKTEASLMWLHNHLKIMGQGRTFYILPYTASINAMYERLNDKMNGNNEIVGVLHGKLSEYIENRFGDEKYSAQNETLKKELKEQFRALLPAIKVATPFQLIKSIFGLKGFEKGIFEMAGGYFIFDEIHAYDPKIIAQIKVLLKFVTTFLNGKVFLMTATLPTFLKKELIDAIGDYIEICADQNLYKSYLRHKVKVLEGLLSSKIELIQDRLDNGEKVLVVCNTVEQAQRIFALLKSDHSVLLHGSFNQKDRNSHEATLKDSGVRLLVGTQAIEVSLDIDYDVIFTEPAPLDALLQRFGRINRHRIGNTYRPPCDCFVFTERNDNDKYIYSNSKVIDDTLTILRRIQNSNDGILHEENLQNYIDEVYPCWNLQDKQVFERVFDHLSNFVWNSLSPFIYDKHREEDFENQFDGIKVLPACLTNEYVNYLENKQFIKAESLKVTIRKQMFAALHSKQDIHLDSCAYPFLYQEKVKEHSFYIIDRRYDEKIGLQIKIEEKVIANQIF